MRARYDKLGDAFGAATYYVTTPERALKGSHRAIASRKPALIDVQLAADSGKESGHIGYLNPAALRDHYRLKNTHIVSPGGKAALLPASREISFSIPRFITL